MSPLLLHSKQVITVITCSLHTNLLHVWHIIIVTLFFCLLQQKHLPCVFAGGSSSSHSSWSLLYLLRRSLISWSNTFTFALSARCDLISNIDIFFRKSLLNLCVPCYKGFGWLFQLCLPTAKILLVATSLFAWIQNMYCTFYPLYLPLLYWNCSP